METRRYINVRTWSENWFETLSASEKLVWIYLNTNSSTNMLGVYSMTVRRIAYECHISEPAARRNIKKLEDIKKLIYSDGYIILIDWMAQQAMNPSMRISAQKEYDKLPKEICAQLSEQTHQSIKSIRQDAKESIGTRTGRDGTEPPNDRAGSQNDRTRTAHFRSATGTGPPSPATGNSAKGYSK